MSALVGVHPAVEVPLTRRQAILALSEAKAETRDEGAHQASPARVAKPRPSTAGLGALSSPEAMTAAVRRAQEGDRQAFGALVTVVQKPLFFSVMRITDDAQDARDVVQRALLKAWQRLGDLENPARFRSWLFTIGLNLARNMRRDQGRRQTEPVEERTLVTQATAPQAISRQQQRRALRRALESLPARQREVVTLRIDAELSFQDIGDTVGCTAATARVNYHHGMKRLRALLSEREA